MLNSKKIISTVLALSMIAATPTVVYAADADNAPTTIVYSTSNERSINWTYTFWVGAGFAIEEDHGQCVGSYELYSDMKSEITLTLMESKDGINWSAVESWTKTNYEYSPRSLIKISTDELKHGYFYLAHTQVQVLDSDDDDNVLETGNVFSNYRYYA